MHIIAGLGNPGLAYARTRHNAGYLAAERLARHWGVAWERRRRFESRWAKAERGAGRVWIGRPETFMNLSGRAVAAAVRFYRVELGRLLVLVDDADLPLGTLRLRGGGSSGGHHGLESIERALGAREYPRLRIGIGRSGPGPARDIIDYVLERFAADEWRLVERVLDRVVAQVECWLDQGLPAAMSRYNGPLNDWDKEAKA